MTNVTTLASCCDGGRPRGRSGRSIAVVDEAPGTAATTGTRGTGRARARLATPTCVNGSHHADTARRGSRPSARPIVRRIARFTETRRRYYAERQRSTRRWLEENPDHYNDYRNKRRVGGALATRNHHALRAPSASPARLDAAGVDELRLHLESLSWQNWGPDGWHVDHVRIASFDLSDPSSRRGAFHYTNTQPM